MTWTKDLETGVNAIDTQHKELIKRINDVVEASMQCKGKDVLESTLNFLGEYVVKHFGDEEELQQSVNYPKAILHKALHDKFVRDFNNLKARFEKESATLDLVLVTNKTLVEWLTKHIYTEDKIFAKYYMENNQ